MKALGSREAEHVDQGHTAHGRQHREGQGVATARQWTQAGFCTQAGLGSWGPRWGNLSMKMPTGGHLNSLLKTGGLMREPKTRM